MSDPDWRGPPNQVLKDETFCNRTPPKEGGILVFLCIFYKEGKDQGLRDWVARVPVRAQFGQLDKENLDIVNEGLKVVL